MLVALSKILALGAYPLGIAMLLLAAGIVCVSLRKVPLGRALSLGALGALYLFSSGPVSYFLVRWLESGYDPQTAFFPASAIVLLTGGEVARMPPRLYDEINEAGDRVLYSARLVRQGAAPLLIATGGTVPFMREIAGSQAEADYRLLTGLLSVDSSRILLETKARNTYENGLFTKRMLDGMGLPPTVILVTSALHMRRSVAIFKKCGCTVYPAPADYLADTPYRWKAISMLPSVGALFNSTNALHEIYGMIAYRLLGWM